MRDDLGNIRINGSGSMAGGNYDNVRINGTGKITGNLECSELVINGSGDATGDVQADMIKINGSGRICGDVKSDTIKVNGSGNFEGDVTCGGLSSSGSADVGKSVNAQTVKVNGMFKTGGDCNAERFDSDGAFEIGGLLNAEDIDVSLQWYRSTAKEIGGENISVKLGFGSHGILHDILSGFGYHGAELQAELIEGSEIFLENTKASVVRGTNVTIGNNCEIGLVEYKGVLNRQGDSQITEERKL